MENQNPNKASNWPFTLFLLVLLIGFGSFLLFFRPSRIGDEPVNPNPSMSRDAIDAVLKKRPDDTPVIGVVINGKAKAFPLKFLMRPDLHVINDEMAGATFAVSFCDIDQCTRVFATKKESRESVRVSGAHRDRPGKLLLEIGKTKFWQDTLMEFGNSEKKAPVELIEHRQTTWGEWKAVYPDSEYFEIKYSQ